jgi:hypothetical protein
MRTVTRFFLPAFLLLVAACGASQETIAQPPPPEPQTTMPAAPTQEPMTPAAGVTPPAPTQPTPAEPATPAPSPPQPITVEHGKSSNLIVSALMLVDASGKKARLMFLNSDATCEDAADVRTKPPSTLVLAADVAMSGEQMDLGKPIKWTYYENGRTLPLKPKAEDVTLTTERIGDELVGTLHVSTMVEAKDLAAHGPVKIITCPAEATTPSGSGGGMKKK